MSGTEPISNEALKALEKGLVGVTLGPWVARENIVKCLLWEIAACTVSENAAHIARCDPQTIAALIARLRAAEAERDDLRASLHDLETKAQRQGVKDGNEISSLRAQVETLREAAEPFGSWNTYSHSGIYTEGSVLQPAKIPIDLIYHLRNALAATEPKP